MKDTDSLISATTRFGHPIPVYDDGFGPLYIHRDSMGISGIVRAQSFEDAYGICEDEFFPEADETIEDIRKEYNFKREHVKVLRNRLSGAECNAQHYHYGHDGKLIEEYWQFIGWATIETPCEDENGWVENELFNEAYGFRPSGPNAKDTLKHGIYAKDLNGDSLERLTPALIEALEITLVIESEPEEPEPVIGWMETLDCNNPSGEKMQSCRDWGLSGALFRNNPTDFDRRDLNPSRQTAYSVMVRRGLRLATWQGGGRNLSRVTPGKPMRCRGEYRVY